MKCWLYLAVVIGLYSRKYNWYWSAIQPTLATEAALAAHLMAVWRRSPQQSVAIHSDQGSQYGRDEWKRFCSNNNLKPSMSRKENCYGNAAMESFFSRLKKDKIRRHVFKTREETSVVANLTIPLHTL